MRFLSLGLCAPPAVACAVHFACQRERCLNLDKTKHSKALLVPPYVGVPANGPVFFRMFWWVEGETTSTRVPVAFPFSRSMFVCPLHLALLLLSGDSALFF